MTIQQIADKVTNGGRVNGSEALSLYREAPTALLGHWLIPYGRASTPNASSPTSSTATSTTRTSASPSALLRVLPSGRVAEGYVLGFDELFRKIDETIAVGGVQLLLQGGHNPDLPLEWYEDSVPRDQAALSEFQLHALSPPEVIHLSRLSQLPVPDGARPADRGRHGQRAWRRRRDPRRPRAQAAALLRQGDAPTNGST
jgi:cyclic dehypoxanthinyl futalosine synthase